MDVRIKKAMQERIELGYTRQKILSEFAAAGHDRDTISSFYDELIRAQQAALPTETITNRTTDRTQEGQRVTNTNAEVDEEGSLSTTSGVAVKTIIIPLFLFLLIAGSGFAYWVASTGMFAGDTGPYSSESEVVQAILSSAVGLEAYRFNTALSLGTEPKVAAAPTVNKELFTEDEYAELVDMYLLSGTGVQIEYDQIGAVDLRQPTSPEMDVSITLNVMGSMMGQPMEFGGAGSYRIADGIVYAKIERVPELLEMFVGPLPRDVWIQVSETPMDTLLEMGEQAALLSEQSFASSFLSNEVPLLDLFGRAPDQPSSRSLSSSMAATALMPFADVDLGPEEQRVLDEAMELVVQYPVIVFADKIETVERNGETIYRYSVDIDYDNLKQVVVSMGEKVAELYDRPTPSESELLVEFPERKWVDEFNRLTDLAVEFRNDGTFAGMQMNAVVTLDDEQVTEQFIIYFEGTTTPDDAINIMSPEELYPQTLEEIMTQQFNSMFDNSLEMSPVLNEGMAGLEEGGI